MITYHTKEFGVASSTALKEFRVSGQQYLAWLENDKTSTAAMREGSAIHMALHEPDRFAATYRSIPAMALRSEADKLAFCEACDVEFLTGAKLKAEELRANVAAVWESRGVRIIDEESILVLRNCAASLNLPCHSAARALVSSGTKELELRWVDPETGVKCKALLDSWDSERGILSDIKRTVAITRRAFQREVLQREYLHQMAFYRRALRAHGEEPRAAAWAAVSPLRPFPWAVYEVDLADLEYVDGKIQHSLREFAECLSSGNWHTINRGEPVTLTFNLDYL